MLDALRKYCYSYSILSEFNILYSILQHVLLFGKKDYFSGIENLLAQQYTNTPDLDKLVIVILCFKFFMCMETKHKQPPEISVSHNRKHTVYRVVACVFLQQH